jgi:hypothetical protein
MSWLRDDDDMLDHEKWRRALRDGGDGALLVWARLRAWCSRRLTDGVIPADMVDEVAEIGRSRARARALRALVEHGLCARRACGSLTIVGYLERNPSRARVLEERDRRSEAQRKRRLGGNVTGHAVSSDEPRSPSVTKSRPGPARPVSLSNESEDARALDVPEVPGLERVAPLLQPVGGSGRVYSLPGADPPKEFLDDALMGGVSIEQARSTWEHYHGAGLPPGGVERLHPWLVKRAKERATQLAKAPKSGPRIVESDLDTTGAATAFRPSEAHREYAGAKGLDAEQAAREYRKGETCRRLDTAEQERDFMNRLRCWFATGRFIPDGPLPRPPAKVKEARA